MKIVEYENNIKEYEINYKNATLKVLNVGAVITELSFNGQNIVQKFADYNSYLDNTSYLGAIVGRSAGRIKDAKVLNGDNFHLKKNYLNKHNLHGNEMHYKFYKVMVYKNVIELYLFDPAGDFVANMELKVTYTLLADRLVQEIKAIADEPTIMNFTNHSYFTLNKKNSVLDNYLQIKANEYLKLDAELIALSLKPVLNTPLDFRCAKQIKSAKSTSFKQFEYSKFIDHPFKLDGSVKLANDELELEIITSNDYLVCYTANYLSDEKKKLEGSLNQDYYAICLETQKRPGDTELVQNYYSKTEFILKVLK